MRFPVSLKRFIKLHLSPLQDFPTLLSHTLRSLFDKDMYGADQCTSEYGVIDLERAAQSVADFITDVQSYIFQVAKDRGSALNTKTTRALCQQRLAC